MSGNGPSPYVLTAIFHRMHEWEKEQADHAAQVKALGMRKKIGSKGTKCHTGKSNGGRIVRRRTQS